MASCNGIEISYELRPCFVNGKKALFHKWGTRLWIVNYPYSSGDRRGMDRGEIEEGERIFTECCAIVEYENGKVERVAPEDLKFANNGLFKEFVWERGTEDE